MRPFWTSVFVALAAAASPPSAAAGPVGPTRAVACAPGDAETAIAVVGRALWVTRNGGRSWSRVLTVSTAADGGSSAGKTAFAFEGPDRALIPAAEELEVEEESAGSAPGARTFPSPGEAGQEASEPLPAVDDEGSWALARGDEVIIGGPGPGVRRRIFAERPRGLLFDREGGLWLVERDRVRLLESGGSRREWTVFSRGAPVRGPGGEIAVPSGKGLWIADPATLEVELRRFGPAEAVAPAGEKGVWIAARRRGLVRVLASGSAVPIGRVPAGTIRLVAGREGRLRARDRRRVWWEKTGSGWRRALDRAYAVDGSGRWWFGTESGPRGPASPKAAASLRPAPAIGAGAVRWELDPGLPPCRRSPLDPLPRLRLDAGFGKGSVRWRSLPEEEEEAGLRSWAYVSIRLSWNLDPIPPADCARENRRFADAVLARRGRAGRIERALGRALGRCREANDAAEIAEWTLETRRLAETLRILSAAKEEEEK